MKINRKSKKTTYQFGSFGEKIAANFLRLKGYSILENRYKNQFGEIDIIAKKDDLITFVEVKTRKKEELLEVILRQKQVDRIKKAAELFLASNQEYYNLNIRFDLILLMNSIIPKHYEGFFE